MRYDYKIIIIFIIFIIVNLSLSEMYR